MVIDFDLYADYDDKSKAVFVCYIFANNTKSYFKKTAGNFFPFTSGRKNKLQYNIEKKIIWYTSTSLSADFTSTRGLGKTPSVRMSNRTTGKRFTTRGGNIICVTCIYELLHWEEDVSFHIEPVESTRCCARRKTERAKASVQECLTFSGRTLWRQHMYTVHYTCTHTAYYILYTRYDRIIYVYETHTHTARTPTTMYIMWCV